MSIGIMFSFFYYILVNVFLLFTNSFNFSVILVTEINLNVFRVIYLFFFKYGIKLTLKTSQKQMLYFSFFKHNSKSF